MDNLKAVVSLGHEALGVNTNEQMNATKVTAKAPQNIYRLYCRSHVRVQRHEPGICRI